MDAQRSRLGPGMRPVARVPVPPALAHCRLGLPHPGRPRRTLIVRRNHRQLSPGERALEFGSARSR